MSDNSNHRETFCHVIHAIKYKHRLKQCNTSGSQPAEQNAKTDVLYLQDVEFDYPISVFVEGVESPCKRRSRY